MGMDGMCGPCAQQAEGGAFERAAGGGGLKVDGFDGDINCRFR